MFQDHVLHQLLNFFILGERPKSAGEEKKELLKQVQALFNKKYGMFVIYSINSALNKNIVSVFNSLYYIY